MIIAYTGLPGTGKTYAMVADAYGTKEKYGCDLFGNLALRSAHFYKDLRQVVSVKKGIICADEMNTLCPSDKPFAVPIEIRNIWTQGRKNEIDLFYTTQDFNKVNQGIRAITNYVWEFEYLFKPPKPREPKKWWHKFHRATRYKPGQMNRVRRKVLETYIFYEKQCVYDLYDTSFRINTPEYLQFTEGIEALPEELPIFSDDLTLDDFDGLDNDEYPNVTGAVSAAVAVVQPP